MTSSDPATTPDHPTQNRPATPGQSPDPATNYERAKPEKEAGQGNLDHPHVAQATPERRPDRMEQAVGNRQDGSRQINGQDDPGGSPAGGGGQPLNAIDLSGRPMPAEQPDHSMKDEEPLGWDQAPTDDQNPRTQRHPRTGGKGGTPDAGEADRRG